MSSRNLFRLSGIPAAVLSQGLGRFIPQLQRVTIKFCKSHGSSRGVREFIENDLIDFARNNETVVVYVKPRRHRSPVLVAEYLNGERKWMSVKDFSRDDMHKWLHLFITQSGQVEKRLIKYIHTNYPSIQGPWSPFCNRKPEVNLAQFPNHEMSIKIPCEPTATEKLLALYKNQKSELNE